MGRIRKRARILRRLLRLRPWPLALAMLALGMVVVLAAGISGLIRAAISPTFAPACLDGPKLCRAASPLSEGAGAWLAECSSRDFPRPAFSIR